MSRGQTLSAAEGVDVMKDVLIPMRDGVRLAADIYIPGTSPPEPLPLVVEYIPYRKDDAARGTRLYEYLPRHGYAVARIDVRGTGGSEGVTTDEYLATEQLDGYDAVEWLASQPFCDGNVNMIGISYGGFTSLQVAAHTPPHLTSVIPICFTDDRYTDDCHYRGGLLRKYYDVAYYGTFMVAFNALPPGTDRADAAQIWEDHLRGNEPYLMQWFRHQTDGPYWRNGSVGDVADRIRCPVFMIGGWRDGYPNPLLRLYAALTVPRKVLIGPWNHAPPDVAVPGPRIDYLHEVVRWLDYWCKGRETGVIAEPPIVVYMQRSERPIVDRMESSGEWRAEAAWPAPEASERVLYPGAGGMLDDEPGSPGVDSFEYDPTVGTTAGLWSGGLPFGLPGDQRTDEARSLVYTSAPLEEELHVLGRGRVVLHASTSASVMAFAVSLSDVGPDGSSHLVAKGMLNATRRHSLVDPEPLTPGEVFRLEIELDATGWIFSPGHRIRLAVASADWPNVWPTPEAGTNLVSRGGEDPFRLVLPSMPARGSARPPAFRSSPAHVGLQSRLQPPPRWEVVHDVLGAETRTVIHAQQEVETVDGALIHREHSLTARVHPDHPASASARGCHVSRIERAGILTEATSQVLVQATASHFDVSIELAVSQNGSVCHNNRWFESVPRVLL
ncbi:MAG: CocE/NonD family hydrolase [Actinobacteria bacterium]|nr:CocE/NonD family hydrolase [Actinomycetota bacterium]